MELFVAAKGLVVHDGAVLLLRESSAYCEGTQVGKWDVPGGRIAPHEPLRDGLVREIEEETGLLVTYEGLLDAYDGFPHIRGAQCHVIRTYFLCTAPNRDVVLSEDHDAYAWIVPKEALTYDLVDDLQDVLTLYMHRYL